jgi:hypothetical protein
MKIEERILRRAKRLLIPSYRWIQGTFTLMKVRRGKTIQCFCSAGAIEEATAELAPVGDDWYKATEFLQRAINRHSDGYSIASWNDKPRRTHAQVIAMFDRAIAMASRETR